jgi:hypothetical protein
MKHTDKTTYNNKKTKHTAADGKKTEKRKYIVTAIFMSLLALAFFIAVAVSGLRPISNPQQHYNNIETGK